MPGNARGQNDGISSSEYGIVLTKRRFLGALGIGGHSPDGSDVMFASHDPNADVMPSARDVATLKTIYCFRSPTP